MKRHIFILVLVAIGATGCTSHRLGSYQQWVSMPTPQSISAGSVWKIIVTDTSGSIGSVLKLAFTDGRATTCEYGDWKAATVLEESPSSRVIQLQQAAYLVEGRAITVMLTHLCDDSTQLKGSVVDNAMSGEYETSTMFGGKTLGRFYGVPIGGA